MVESWKKLKTSNEFSLFIVLNQNRSAQVHELLSNDSLFLGLLYENESLVLRARDLIFYITDIKTVDYYPTFHC